MHIERLQVEAEGFLSGLDIEFAQGLNVIIGARGTGKTSIVELIRFCLDAGSFTEDARLRGEQQAVAILSGGAVTLTMADGLERFTITRSASGHTTSSDPTRSLICTVLAQNEMEAVGAQSSGRLRLIDRFRPNRSIAAERVQSQRTQLRSLTSELMTLVQEGVALNAEIDQLSPVTQLLSGALERQSELLKGSTATQEQQDRLKRLQSAAQRVSAKSSLLGQDAAQLEQVRSEIRRLEMNLPHALQPWPDSVGDDPLTNERDLVAQAVVMIDLAAAQLEQAAAGVDSAKAEAEKLRASIDEQSRDVRQTLDQVREGVGQASRQVAELEEKQGQLNSLHSRLEDRRRRFRQLVQERDLLREEVEKTVDAVFDERQQIVNELNAELSPTIRIRVQRSSNVEEYRDALVAAFRGTGIHYNSLAPQLAREVAPHELVTWTETLDADSLSGATGVSRDRALAVLTALRNPNLAGLFAANIEDGATLELLDGGEYKPSDQLSIGQRCTAVLPVLLGQHGDPLILDQPEDHLDNAFVASTLVEALQRRHADDQYIFTSHNANIPVLGNADRIIHMGSDGKHGYVASAGALDEPEAVSAVTGIMEGGARAFALRAAFYGQESQ
ncbi:AAA family ATPase [Aeromicrobium sp. Root236]|uniref:AAA family ATPase n=1 Tax=Aeromicrobium sp. Root236 TaxID=1736498 RepID=UPI000A68B2B7|nr:AAA family ATPase [Aeromicrobium sp. Root236]